MDKNYRVGTRTSPLALKQVGEVLSALKKDYPDIDAEIVGIASYGDRDKTTPIKDVEGSDFFTREIDKALLRGDIDFAIHSAKDLPDILERGLSIAAITKSIDPFDVLVSRSGLRLEKLPYGARIGTSSLRRKEALKRFRPDFQIVNIRGNIEERLGLLTKPCPPQGWTWLDGIVIARAGLIRLGLEDRITQTIPFDILKPHPLQGALAILTRSEDTGLIKLLSKLDSREAIPV